MMVWVYILPSNVYNLFIGGMRVGEPLCFLVDKDKIHGEAPSYSLNNIEI